MRCRYISDLRKVLVYPGTDPFRSVKYTENEVWIMEKNKNYWSKELPYLDGIEFYHVLPFSPEMASAILANRVDYVFATDPATFRKATATPPNGCARSPPCDAPANVKKKSARAAPRMRRRSHVK